MSQTASRMEILFKRDYKGKKTTHAQFEKSLNDYSKLSHTMKHRPMNKADWAKYDKSLDAVNAYLYNNGMPVNDIVNFTMRLSKATPAESKRMTAKMLNYVKAKQTKTQAHYCTKCGQKLPTQKQLSCRAR